MYDIIDLNSRKVAELRDIAKELNIARTDKLKKQELVYAILDEQAFTTSAKAKADGDDGDKKESGKKPDRYWSGTTTRCCQERIEALKKMRPKTRPLQKTKEMVAGTTKQSVVTAKGALNLVETDLKR